MCGFFFFPLSDELYCSRESELALCLGGKKAQRERALLTFSEGVCEGEPLAKLCLSCHYICLLLPLHLGTLASNTPLGFS